MAAPSLYPNPIIKSNGTVLSCNKCDFRKKVLLQIVSLNVQ